MFDYLADVVEGATACEASDGACRPQRADVGRQEELSGWGDYARFMCEQQESYCQLV